MLTNELEIVQHNSITVMYFHQYMNFGFAHRISQTKEFPVTEIQSFIRYKQN